MAVDVVAAAYRELLPQLLDPIRVAALAAAALDEAGMLCAPPVPAGEICGPCGHESELHIGGCCRGEGPPAYGACKCGRFRARPRLEVVS